MQRIAVLVLVSLLLLVGAVFASGTAEGAEEQPHFGLVNINLQALFFNQIYEGAQEAAEENGVRLTHVNGQNDPGRQVEAIENLTTQGVDAIILVAIDVDGVVPAVEDARAAGIPTIAIDAKVETPPAAAFIGVDNYGAGVEAGEFVLEYINNNLDGEARVGIVGALNSFIQNQRLDGFVDALEEQSGITIVNTVDGQNVQETAMQASEDLVTANPDMDLIYATGEPALIGAIAAAEAGGYTDEIDIMGWDLSEQAVRGIDEGFVNGVVQQNPYEEGYVAVETALKLIEGEDVPGEILIPIDIVTTENIDEYRGLFE